MSYFDFLLLSFKMQPQTYQNTMSPLYALIIFFPLLKHSFDHHQVKSVIIQSAPHYKAVSLPFKTFLIYFKTFCTQRIGNDLERAAVL